jgi:hypothetical protein
MEPGWTMPSNSQDRNPRFSLATLLMITMVLAIGAASLGGMLRGGADRRTFVVLSCAAPVFVAVLVGVIRWIVFKTKK